METGLAGYDAACAAIASAKNVDEVKQIHDKAEAVRAYARQAKNKTLEIDAAEIRIRAERRLGELLAVMPKATGAKGIGNPKSALVKREHTATLKQMGVSMDLSARAQGPAAVPAEAFEEKISEWRGLIEEENERVTTNLLKIGDESQKHIRGTFGTSENEWYTPTEYVELARRVLGEIDLDPASSDGAQTTVKAKEYFTPLENGLRRNWNGAVYLNPPYSQPDIGYFVSKLVAEQKAGRVTAAILLTHNYTDTAWFHKAAGMCAAICFTRGRVKFQDAEGKPASPTQGQAFFYFGENVALFSSVFKSIGFVLFPCGREMADGFQPDAMGLRARRMLQQETTSPN